jgi:N-acetylated-alpha-linked acidic dipeptidase
MIVSAVVLLALHADPADPAALAARANEIASATSLAAIHAELTSEPHVAGTPGDRRQIERLAAYFRGLGLETEVHEIRPYLARPIAASLEIVGEDAPAGGRRGVQALDLRERNLVEDPSTAHPDLTWGWNAFSGSGSAEAEVVYANYGTREDFRRLAELGVDCRGKIVLARYGGNFRGYKAKFAEAAGAAGLVIFTDPGDSGFTKGPTWPDGGWANETCIQRGSLLTLPQPGDPLTPGVEATESAPRLDPAEIALPKIPVQPIGYAAAERIIARMRGREVVDAAWKGGLPVTYRLEGGPDLRLRLKVEQERFLGSTANVIARLPGATRPAEEVIVGCHHDAWGFGAADPHAGTMVLLETARSLAEAARAGVRPARSVVFAAWGAEEFGIIGSVEWVEGRRERLERNAIAYLNLDMAAMGPNLGMGGSPALGPAAFAALSLASDPFADRTVLDGLSRDGKPPSLGNLGGGSDHVGFWCHAGVPSLTLGSGGSAGTSYHSNYDTVAWYRKTVGDDYRAALLVTRACNAIVASFASGGERPDDPRAMLADARRLVDAARGSARAAGFEIDLSPLDSALVDATSAAEAWPGRPLPPIRRDADRAAIRTAWLDADGLPGRPWFRNRYAATDRHSGYGAAMLPDLAEAIEDRDPERARAAIAELAVTVDRIRAILAAP